MSDEPGHLYVVMASRGEWSDRVEWVCGVFSDMARAKALVEQHSAAERAAQAVAHDWLRRFRSEVGMTVYHGPLEPITPARADFDQRAARFIEQNGPRPEDLDYDTAEKYWLVCVRPNEWGRWDTFDLRIEMHDNA